MISSTRPTISSIVVLFSSINYDIVSVRSVRTRSPTTHAKTLERRSCRPDRCLSVRYYHERLLGDIQNQLKRVHQSLSMLLPPSPRFVDVGGVR
jgi:hypothetical protein